jgi:predicted neuraminidase
VFLLDHAGTLWLYHVTLAGQGWTTAHLMRQRSPDLGRRWQQPEPLGMEEGLMFRSRPLDLARLDQPDHWLLPIYDEKTWRSLMLLSADDGASWSPGQFIVTPPGNIHACVVPLADGRLLAFLRTGGKGGSIWRTTSGDHGRTWAMSEPTPLPNPNAGLDLLRLRSGALVLAFNNSSHRRTPLCVALSDDEGLTWPHMRTLQNEDGEFSYPTLIESQSGRIHGVYTWRRQWIQSVEFDEAWLREGQAWTGEEGPSSFVSS